jgi:hypothetical protein
MTTHIADRILLALFSLSRDTRPIDATRLGRATGHSATLAARALLFLEKHGWVDATRARLTLLGLARAVQIGADHGGGGGHHRGPAMPTTPVTLRSVDCGVASRIAPKARRKPPLAALPMPTHAAADAADAKHSAARAGACQGQGSSSPEPCEASPRPVQLARRPRARANVPARLAAAHV